MKRNLLDEDKYSKSENSAYDALDTDIDSKEFDVNNEEEYIVNMRRRPRLFSSSEGKTTMTILKHQSMELLKEYSHIHT